MSIIFAIIMWVRVSLQLYVVCVWCVCLSVSVCMYVRMCVYVCVYVRGVPIWKFCVLLIQIILLSRSTDNRSLN